MYEELTKHFLSMQYDKNNFPKYLERLSNASFTKDTLPCILNEVFPDWTFKISHFIGDRDWQRIAGTLFLPGHTYDGTGSDVNDAIFNIINSIIKKVNINSDVSNIPQETIPEQTEQPKQTSASILNELQSIKNNTSENAVQQVKNDTDDLFDSLMNANPVVTQTPVQEQQSVQQTTNNEPKYVDFDSPECDEIVKNFNEQFINNPLKTYTPEEVNPNHEFMKPKWTTPVGAKLSEWMKLHNVTTKEQMTSWFMKFCGLEYDYFNPDWLDKFIAWTEALREQQTY